METFKSQVEFYLKTFFDHKITEFRKIDPIATEIIMMAKDFTLNGGKRIRAQLVYSGYLAAGGKNLKNIIEPAAAIELIQSFFLIHDDIIDRSDTRRHQKTIHIKYQDNYKKHIANDLAHFGNSMAIIVGDLVLSLAYKILNNSSLSKKQTKNIFKKAEQIIQQTIIGEALDVVCAFKKQSGSNTKENEKTIEKIHLLKTAKYTIEGPLHLGALYGQANRKLLDQLSKFAIPLGIAYQIKDDIEGVFGNEKQTGKSVTSDIAEGKQTLLTIKALANANSAQKKFLQKYLGNKNITKKDLEKLKNIITETRSLKYSQDKILTLTKKARSALDNLKFNKNYLGELIDFIEDRK